MPNSGLSGSPALFAPKSREVAFGLDYWITPSIAAPDNSSPPTARRHRWVIGFTTIMSLLASSASVSEEASES